MAESVVEEATRLVESEKPDTLVMIASRGYEQSGAGAEIQFGEGIIGMVAEAKAIEAGGGQYADITKLFCSENRCPAIVGNTMVYFDAGHVTREYSEFLVPALGALADRALAQK